MGKPEARTRAHLKGPLFYHVFDVQNVARLHGHYQQRAILMYTYLIDEIANHLSCVS